MLLEQLHILLNNRLARFIFFIALLFISDQIIGSLLRHLYFNQKAGQQQSLTYVLSDAKADILIFGNSRAQHHYVSRILKDSLQMSCYNAGQDGGHSILLSYAQIKVITERYSPKIIILEFHPDNIVHYPGDYDRLSILLPYYNKYPDLRPIIKLRSPYERVKLILATYPFNSNIINIIKFNINTYADGRNDIEGYVPLKGKIVKIETLKTEPEALSEPDTNKIIALKKIISLCKEKEIALFIITSPVYHSINDIRPAKSLAATKVYEILNHEKVFYYDFSFNSTFIGHMEWFKDKAHLNDDGAKIFTSYLAEMIKSQIRTIKAH
jgi:hypothetical protein